MKLKFASKSKAGVSLTKNSIVMLIMLVTIVLATLAWFTMTRYSEALDVYVGTDKSYVIQFAMPEENGNCPTDESKFFSYLDIQEKLSEVLKSDSLKTFTKELTGDGKVLVSPELERIPPDSPLTVKENGTWKKAVPNQDYVSISFYVRSTNKAVYMSANSYLETGAKKLVGADVANKSSYGDFSKDAIAGAVRVSIQDVTSGTPAGVAKKDFVWIPRPDLQLQSENGVYSLLTGVAYNSETDTLVPASYKHTYYVPKNNADADNGTGLVAREAQNVITPVVTDETTNAPILASEVPLSNYAQPEVKDGTEFYFYKYTVNMWIEGTDSESVSALNGGNFTLYLNFTA